MPDFPMPNDKHPDGIVVASVWYNEDLNLATILVLGPQPPFFRVGTWDFVKLEWNGGYYEDHMNIVPAINGARHTLSPITMEPLIGYQGLGGDC